MRGEVLSLAVRTRKYKVNKVLSTHGETINIIEIVLR